MSSVTYNLIQFNYLYTQFSLRTAKCILINCLIYSPVFNRPFPSCFEPHYESEAKCKVFVMKISFNSYANKTKFLYEKFCT